MRQLARLAPNNVNTMAVGKQPPFNNSIQSNKFRNLNK